MIEKIITYEILFELLRNEKTKHEIQKLDENFYQNFLTYLDEKQKIIDKEDKDDIFSVSEKQKTIVQMQNIKRIIRDFYERREKKVIDLAIVNSRSGNDDTVNLLNEEKAFYDELLSVLNKYRNQILNMILENKTPNVVMKEEEETLTSNLLIKFIHAVPQFYGENLELFGPFEENDFANLPRKISNVIVNKGRAEHLRIDNFKYD